MSKFALEVLRQAMVRVEMTRQGLLTFFARMKQPGAPLPRNLVCTESVLCSYPKAC